MTDNRSNTKEHSVNLAQKSKADLLDLLQRQNTILATKKFVEKLPDRGKKLKQFKTSIEAAIRKLDSVSNVTDLFHGLHVSEQDRPMLDSDDDDDCEPNIYATLATNGVRPKTTMKSMAEINPPFVEKLTKQMEQNQSSTANNRERLPLNRCVNCSSTSKADESWNTVQGTWIETAATPTPAKFKEAKKIMLTESYELQRTQYERQKELQAKHAGVFLAEHAGRETGTNNPYAASSFASDPSYRDAVEAADYDDD